MKLKHPLVMAFLWCSINAFSTSSDTTQVKKVMHHFQLLIGNYVSESFVGPAAKTFKPYYAPPGQVNYGANIWSNFYNKPNFIPMYSYSAGFIYTADLSSLFGIRTGINYFTYGYVAKGYYDPCPSCSIDANLEETFRRVIFISSLQVPLHLIVYQKCRRGRLVFSAGPDILLPINTFGTESFKPEYIPLAERIVNVHYHLSATDFLRGGSMGFSAGLGYEKTLSKKLIIELLPEFYLANLVPFDFEGQGKGIYQNYIFNAAFGLSTYLTFMK